MSSWTLPSPRSCASALVGRERTQARAHPSGGGKHCSAEDNDDELGLAAGPGFFKHLFEGSACRLVTDIERGSCRTQRFAGDEPKGKARFRRRQAVLNLQWRDVPVEYHSSTCRSQNGTQPAAMEGKPYNLVSAGINSLLILLAKRDAHNARKSPARRSNDCVRAGLVECCAISVRRRKNSGRSQGRGHVCVMRSLQPCRRWPKGWH
jgi:hypothetical protein